MTTGTGKKKSPAAKRLDALPVWLAAAPLVLALGGLLWLAARSPRGRAWIESWRRPPPLPSAESGPLPPPAPTGPRLAIVIDDLGYQVEPIERLLRIRAPLTFAVMPGRPFSRQCAGLVVREGRELILHQPMEALVHAANGAAAYGEFGGGAPDPGPGAVYLKMSAETVTATVEANLSAFPEVVGMNNHMGSAFTRSASQMEAALRPLVARGLYFLDSRTIGDSAAYAVAGRLGLRAARRDVFLDDTIDSARIAAQLREVAALARSEGRALAIGHPHPETVGVLEREIPKLLESGIRLVYAGVLAAPVARGGLSAQPRSSRAEAAPPPAPPFRGRGSEDRGQSSEVDSDRSVPAGP